MSGQTQKVIITAVVPRGKKINVMSVTAIDEKRTQYELDVTDTQFATDATRDELRHISRMYCTLLELVVRRKDADAMRYASEVFKLRGTETLPLIERIKELLENYKGMRGSL